MIVITRESLKKSWKIDLAKKKEKSGFELPMMNSKY